MILGIDIGGTKTAVVLGTPRGEIRWRKQFPTRPERGFQAFFQELAGVGMEGIAQAKNEAEAVSVSIGGPLDVLRGIVKSPPNLPGWTDVPLKQLLADRFLLPVYVEHDGNAGAIAEHLFGAGKGFRNIVFLTMGTGLGAGLILDGKLYRGTTDTAGEIGHIRIADDGPLSYGKAGSLEGYASGTGIMQLARMMFPQTWGESATILDVYRDFQSGAQPAREVFVRAGKYFGRGLAMLADLLNPERIILGGIGMRIGDALLPEAERVFREEALPSAHGGCAIVSAALGEAIGDVASLCAAIDQGTMEEKD